MIIVTPVSGGNIMECIECKAANPDGNQFCGQCGAELGRTAAETIRKTGVRDRRVVEWEITEAVVSKLSKWARWITAISVVVIAAFAFGLSMVYSDARTAVDAGRTQIENTVAKGQTDINSKVGSALQRIDSTSQMVNSLQTQVKDLKKQMSGYAEVNAELENLLKEFHGQTSDLSKLNLRVHTLEAVPGPNDTGPSALSFFRVGCGTAASLKGAKVMYCAQGNPVALFQRTGGGVIKPVAGTSPVGFQDTSTSPKPSCTLFKRGTFYVEKGQGRADEPFLCARESDDQYKWIRLAEVP